MGRIDHPDGKIPDRFKRVKKAPERTVIKLERVGTEIGRDLGQDMITAKKRDYEESAFAVQEFYSCYFNTGYFSFAIRLFWWVVSLYHPLPIIKFGSQSAICGKANRRIKARTRAERKGTTPL